MDPRLISNWSGIAALIHYGLCERGIRRKQLSHRIIIGAARHQTWLNKPFAAMLSQMLVVSNCASPAPSPVCRRPPPTCARNIQARRWQNHECRKYARDKDAVDRPRKYQQRWNPITRREKSMRSHAESAHMAKKQPIHRWSAQGLAPPCDY